MAEPVIPKAAFTAEVGLCDASSAAVVRSSFTSYVGTALESANAGVAGARMAREAARDAARAITGGVSKRRGREVVSMPKMCACQVIAKWSAGMWRVRPGRRTDCAARTPRRGSAADLILGDGRSEPDAGEAGCRGRERVSGSGGIADGHAAAGRGPGLWWQAALGGAQGRPVGPQSAVMGLRAFPVEHRRPDASGGTARAHRPAGRPGRTTADSGVVGPRGMNRRGENRA